MSSGDAPGIIKAVLDGQITDTSHLAFLSTSVWFLWDWVITIDSEIEHFWGKPLTTGSMLYFANRVLGVIGIILHGISWLAPIGVTGGACKPVVFVYIMFSALSTTVVQTVLALRTYALWDCNRKIYVVLMALNIASALVQQGLNVRNLLPGKVIAIPNPLPAPYDGCMMVFKTGTWHRFVPIVVFEFSMAVFLTIKFVENIQHGKSSRVLYILFRDGFIEFITVTVGSILCLLTGTAKWANKYDIAIIILDVTTSVSAICCARLLLNIKDVMKLSDPSDPLEWQPRWTLMNVGSLPSGERQDDRVYEPPGFYESESPAMLEMSQIEVFDDFLED
ncbi:hypothetical protein DL93DRAFT_2233690 [Clavulina sp. PMI_390]|nr:hypothetical protein DL93DRAFT_2233690 [Clavulina sp. PMI_390]